MDDQELDAVVGDAVREGWQIESQAGGTVALRRWKPLSVGGHLLRALGVGLCLFLGLLFWPLALIAIPLVVMWVRDARAQDRVVIYRDDDGQLVQDFS